MSIDRLESVGSPADFAARSAASGVPRSRVGSSVVGPLESLSADAFHRVLQQATAADALAGMATHAAEEAVHRLERGRLHIPDLRLLLLDTPATPVWARARQEALTQVVASPTLAPSIISIHAQLLRLPSATVREGHGNGSEPAFVAQATFAVDGRDTAGSVQRARTRKGARQQAMASLVAALAGLDDPFTEHIAETYIWQTGTPASSQPASRADSAPVGGRSPISVLHEYAQAGHIERPDFRVTTHSSTHFTATVTATHRQQRLTGTGSGTNKQAARSAAADDFLTALKGALAADHADAPPEAPEREHDDTPVPPAPAGPARASLQESPAAIEASAQDLFRARALIDQLLADGAAVTVLPSRHPARTAWMFFRPDGTPLAEVTTAPPPLQAVTRDLVLAGPGGIMPRRATVTGIAAPFSFILPALLTARDDEHPSAAGWRHAVRLGLECVAQQRVYPSLTAEGYDCWRIGPVTDPLRRAAADASRRLAPEGHCLLAGTTPVRIPAPEGVVWTVLDAVADAMLRAPGATILLGPGPYSGPAHDIRPTPQLWTWADEIEDALDPHPVPALVLRIRQPDDSGPAPAVPITLHLDPGDGQDTVSAASVWSAASPHPGLTTAMLPGVRRVLRRASRAFAPLAQLAAQEQPGGITLSAHDLALLHLHATGPLAELGITTHWPPHLTDVLTATAVIGTLPAPDTVPETSGYLALERLVDCRWHINVDGEPLTEEEMTALAEAAWPLIQLRGRWLLIDPDTARRARDRTLNPLPSLDALAAA
ncbi:SNF2 helicase-associated domain-containing protein, partial [Streptomyces graminilatus]|uniref:SNF2 helicase-associated domain-containing protein n=1 Tax=Streptomyces graminilatus TaxID=1464070 RepID=UPI000A427EC5